MPETIDLSTAPLYTLDYTDSPIFVECYGYKIQLPNPPPDEEIINYGLPEDEQVYRKTLIPDDLQFWDEDDQEVFVSREMHRRRNGVWVFIKGKKYYIPGVFYFFLNYWKLKSGKEVIFRMTDLHFFLTWIHCLRTKKCLGLIDFKCRQIGDTEKVLCIMYDFASRYRNIKAAMQSAINETHVKKSYHRLIYAHDKMIWFMKPINKGTDNPDAALEFRYPSQQITTKRLQNQFKKNGSISATNLEYKFPALESEIQYGPSSEFEFDGQTWNLYYLDEFGKAERMDPIKAWGVIKPAMISRILDTVLGKGIFTSTVEEMKSGKSLKWSKRLWRDSDPNDIGENGETKSGLFRIFRSALDRAPVDRWGFPKVEAELRRIKADMKAFMDKKDMRGLIEYRRKNPLTIDDVFMSAENESSFHIENLAGREIWLQNQKFVLEVRGNFKWKDGQRDTEVIWEPNSQGRWYMSMDPRAHGMPTNAKIEHIQMPKPALIHKFCGGVDPYDQTTNIEEDLSMGGIVVRRKFDGNIDGNKFDEQGKPMNGGMDWETERVVCDYLYRHQNPEEFFEDVIMTFVYFGTEFLFEKNKGAGLELYVKSRGYSLYIQEQPDFTRSKSAQNKELVGITATPNSVNQLFELIQTETCDYVNTIHHTRYLAQLIRTNYDNRGDNDITMAGGWALVASKRMVAPPRDTERAKKIRHYTEELV